ncbi:MAG: acyl-phosphate glycerol 3-phosphate acyltransferase [Chloroflexi bacterium]|nr:acyl-phosphate glycerol 3-phosphate acyltransferase [Chloroflexota bacterium]|tara:strand:+ start:22750 stop:23397 length:648 start_codon:yes stop_codon:yes gene_type:complete
MILQLSLNILTGILAYLIGSIQFGLIFGKLIRGIDIREHGSGSTGATNVGRTLGVKIATGVALIDIGKGFLIVYLFVYLLKFSDAEIPSYSMILIGSMVIIGHCWPVYYRFKGGKGVLTSLGVYLLVNPLACLIALTSFIIIATISKYVSLGSLVGGSLALIYVIISFFTSIGSSSFADILFTLFIFCVIFYRHKENIQRLIKGKENKIGNDKKP